MDESVKDLALYRTIRWLILKEEKCNFFSKYTETVTVRGRRDRDNLDFEQTLSFSNIKLFTVVNNTWLQYTYRERERFKLLTYI